MLVGARSWAVAGIVLALSLTALPAASAATPAAVGWNVVYTLPAQNGDTDTVEGIAATGPNNAWAVGGKLQVVGGQAEGVAAVFHWNGKSWSQRTLPGPVHEGYFSAVSASSASDVWAVGGCEECTPFAANWNGKKWTWYSSVSSSADPSAAAFSTSNVWVADYSNINHWNGTSWKQYTAPGWNGVWSLSGVAPDNIWAAGLAVGGLQPEALHWTGGSWKATTIPTMSLPVNGQAIPQAVVAESSANVWEGGDIQWPDPTSGLTDHEPFMLHWNGTTWSQLSMPSSLPQDYGFAAVAPDGTGGFWATDVPADSVSGSQPEYLEHYSDGQWTQDAVPVVAGTTNTTVSALAGVSGSQDLWAATTFQNAQGDYDYAIASYTP
jgi:hypothetical protein